MGLGVVDGVANIKGDKSAAPMIVKSAETCQPGKSILLRGISLKHEPSLFISEWFELTPPEIHSFFVSKS